MDFRLMDVPECPIIVSRCYKLADCAWCVRSVTGVTLQRGVQQRDVEAAWRRRTIGRRDVLESGRFLVAAAMDRDAKVG